MIDDDYDPHPCHDDDAFSRIDLIGGTISDKEVRHRLRRAFSRTALEYAEDLTGFNFPKGVHKGYNAIVDAVLDTAENPAVKRVAKRLSSAKEAMLRLFGRQPRQ